MDLRLGVPVALGDPAAEAADQHGAWASVLVPSEYLARCEWGRRRFRPSLDDPTTALRRPGR